MAFLLPWSVPKVPRRDNGAFVPKRAQPTWRRMRGGPSSQRKKRPLQPSILTRLEGTRKVPKNRERYLTLKNPFLAVALSLLFLELNDDCASTNAAYEPQSGRGYRRTICFEHMAVPFAFGKNLTGLEARWLIDLNQNRSA